VAASLQSVLGVQQGGEELASALRALGDLTVSGAAAWIRALDRIEASRPGLDLVWSGPEVPGLHAGDTRRVFEELLAGAQRSIWASTYAFFDGPRALEPEGPAGVLHAKALVVDEQVALITSANLTEAALERNIELGILVRDPALASSIALHLRTLIERGLLQPLPEQ